MTIDPASGLIQWVPDGSQGGDNSVTVRVTDSVLNTYDESLTVSVTNLNERPAIVASRPSTTTCR